MGTDQFGAHILLSGSMVDQVSTQTNVFGRFSNVELYHVGQAFRLGRYPIHFHMNGDMSTVKNKIILFMMKKTSINSNLVTFFLLLSSLMLKNVQCTNPLIELQIFMRLII